ncbi:carbonic anhydrase 1-like isoform X2 [Ornithodoros turicata]|uniref:carbonic anhydrase 1-like isoform X2 n=1 Tax=Ornithodoros turicata TaxID=34597 RepID=UPI0031397A1E
MNKRRPVELLSLTLLLHACTRTEPAPDTWPATFPLCGGSMQSPVELRFLQSVYKPMSPMHFFNYDYEMALDVQIIGTNLLLFPNSSRLAVFGGPLKVEYTFVMGAFHFGKGEFDGSEHKIDSTGYAAELQLIHYTETNIGINCFKGVNGLLALAILFKQVPANNSELDEFISNIPQVRASADKPTTIPNFYLSSFMPQSTINFYLYSGSLTFPPCTERLITVVFERAVSIGKSQLEALRTLKGQLKHARCKLDIAGNTRIAPARGSARPIYRSFRFIPSQRATTTSCPTSLTMLACLVIFHFNSFE